MNSQHDNGLFSHPFPENRVSWITLTLLFMGVITTFYYQDTTLLETVSPHMHRHNSPEAKMLSGSLLTIYDEETGKPQTVISLDDAKVR